MEVFLPMVKLTTIRMVLGIVTTENLHLEQLDVKKAFLHSDLEEEIYMVQPEAFKTRQKQVLVCKLKQSLYGLKQAPSQWYKKFDKFMFDRQFGRGNILLLLQRFCVKAKLGWKYSRVSKYFKDGNIQRQAYFSPLGLDGRLFLWKLLFL